MSVSGRSEASHRDEIYDGEGQHAHTSDREAVFEDIQEERERPVDSLAWSKRNHRTALVLAAKAL